MTQQCKATILQLKKKQTCLPKWLYCFCIPTSKGYKIIGPKKHLSITSNPSLSVTMICCHREKPQWTKLKYKNKIRILYFFSSVQSLSHVQLFGTPWIAASQASLSITNSQSSLTINFSTKVAVLCLVTQSCPTLCDSMDCSLPGSSIYGILQARILEWVPISFSRGSSRLRDRTHDS